MDRARHWDELYDRLPSTVVSWYEREPSTSLRLIERNPNGPDAVVIDVGGGTSELVDRLVMLGYRDVTVLDVSSRALDEVRRRLGPGAERVSFVTDDVLAWEPERRYDVWHDRAVFHFLTDPEDQQKYVAIAAHALSPHGLVVIATFAEDGPTSCSGLPVARYSTDALAGAFAPAFALEASEREEHRTPTGVLQPLTWGVLVRQE